MVVFDVTNQASFDNLAHWIQEIRAWDDDYQLCVVGNKMDLEKERVIPSRHGEEFVEALGGKAVYVECSAKLDINCKRVFSEITRLCRAAAPLQTTPTTSTVSPSVQLSNDAPREQSNFACPCS